MKEQRVIITSLDFQVNDLLQKGWVIVSITAAHDGGKFCFILERNK